MKRLLALVLGALLLAGCGGNLDAAERLQDKTAQIVDDANSKDVDTLRASIEELRKEVNAQQQAGSLPRAKAELLLRLLAALEKDAPALTATPEPTATPSATPSSSPTPSPTPSATPSATPSPTPEPSQEPTTEPTQEPTSGPSGTALPTLSVGKGNGGGKQNPQPSATPTP